MSHNITRASTTTTTFQCTAEVSGVSSGHQVSVSLLLSTFDSKLETSNTLECSNAINDARQVEIQLNSKECKSPLIVTVVKVQLVSD